MPKMENTFFWNRRVSKIPNNIVPGVEINTGTKLNGKDIFVQLLVRGDPWADSFSAIASSGDLITGVEKLISVSGVIRRNVNAKQIHNINAVNNLPDQHASIIWLDLGANKISYYYASTMTQTTFKDAPFEIIVEYTKV